MKNVLTIAGSDPSAGAGIQADLKTISALGGYGLTIITAVTAQNTQGVYQVQEISSDMVYAQLEALFSDIQIDAVKIGMLNSSSIVNVLADFLNNIVNSEKPIPIIIDPVIASSSGYQLLSYEGINVIKTKLFPISTVITPNIIEAELLTDMKIENMSKMEIACKILLEYGSEWVIVKGGHLLGEPIDVVANKNEFFYLKSNRVITNNNHGTGCSYSSAIATYLAHGLDFIDAVRNAKQYVKSCLENGFAIGRGVGVLGHFQAKENLWQIKENTATPPSPCCIYLVSDREVLKGRDLVEAVMEAVDGGVTTVQLREKNASSREFYNIGMELMKRLDEVSVPLIINDRLDIALAIDADGLHIGQNDLPLRDARRLLGNDKIIGLTVKSIDQAVAAEREGADYLGVGPVFSTSTKKDISVPPLGIEGLKKYKESCSIPIIAIGGINMENISLIKQTGIAGVAVVSGILAQDNIKQTTKRMKDLWIQS